MGFKFSLQSVLRLRQSVEHQQELRLRAANQQVSQMLYGVEQVERRRSAVREAQSCELSKGITAAELRFELQCEAELLRYKNELERQLIRMQQIRDQQRDLFQRARIARETLDTVRDKQLSDYKQEAVRRDQRNLDDMFLLRRQIRRG